MVSGITINFMGWVNFFLKMDHIIKVHFVMVKLKEKVDIYSIMDAFIKVIFIKMRHMVRGVTLILSKIISIMAIGKKINLMVKVSKNLEMVPITKDNFKKG